MAMEHVQLASDMYGPIIERLQRENHDLIEQIRVLRTVLLHIQKMQRFGFIVLGEEATSLMEQALMNSDKSKG